MSTPKELLGKAIRRARKVRGLRQEDIAQRLETNVRQVRRWELGEHTPGGITLGRIVRYFRELADTPDLAALDAIVAEEATADTPDDERQIEDRDRALILLDQLIVRHRNFERWISYGYGLLDADDDRP